MANIPMHLVRIAVAAGFALVCFQPSTSFANDSDSGGGGGAAQCSKFKRGSKDWKECMAQRSQDREDAYTLAYWMAKTGEYQDALNLLQRTGDDTDPRVLTMIGYVTRHLGRVDEAMGYYTKALAINPNLTNTRQYFGEAFLQKGEPMHAREQLAEIAERCGQNCEDYRSLDQAISVYEKGIAKG
jgi:tetratricopeptide (TPR) repeat protein